MFLSKNLNSADIDEKAKKKEFLVDYPNDPLPHSHKAWPHFAPSLKNNFRPAYLEKLESEVIKQAKEKALFIEKEAYEQGFNQGEKNGWEMAQKKITVLADNFQKLFQEMENKLDQLYEQHGQALIKLALEITKKILHQDYPFLEDIIIKNLSAVWQYVKENKKIIIHLHPKDYEYLMANSSLCPFLGPAKELGKVEMVADPIVTRGGCYLQTTVGDIDATLETQFDQLVSSIWQKLIDPRD